MHFISKSKFPFDSHDPDFGRYLGGASYWCEPGKKDRPVLLGLFDKDCTLYTSCLIPGKITIPQIAHVPVWGSKIYLFLHLERHVIDKHGDSHSLHEENLMTLAFRLITGPNSPFVFTVEDDNVGLKYCELTELGREFLEKLKEFLPY